MGEDVVFVDHSALADFCAFKPECCGPTAFTRPMRSGFVNSSVDDDTRVVHHRNRRRGEAHLVVEVNLLGSDVSGMSPSSPAHRHTDRRIWCTCLRCLLTRDFLNIFPDVKG